MVGHFLIDPHHKFEKGWRKNIALCNEVNTITVYDLQHNLPVTCFSGSHLSLLATVTPCSVSMFAFCIPVPQRHSNAPFSQDIGCYEQAREPVKGEPCVTPATRVPLTSDQSGASDHSRPSYRRGEHITGSWTDLLKNVGAGGGTGPDVEGSEQRGTESVTHAENKDKRGGVSGPVEVETGAKIQGREAERLILGKETPRKSVDTSELNPDKEVIRSTTAAAPEAESQTRIHPAGERRDLILEERPDLQGKGELRQSLPDLDALHLGQETETSRPSFLSLSSFITNSHLTSIPPLTWGSREATSLPPSGLDGVVTAIPLPQDKETAPALSELLLPDLGAALTGSSRQDDPDSLWTEPQQQNEAVDASATSLQEAAMEGTMSSEDLPLIFEPLDVTPEGAGIATATVSPDNSQTSFTIVATGMLLSEVELDQVVTLDKDNIGPSHVPPPVLLDWTLPWQISGGDNSEPINPSGLPIDMPSSKTELLLHPTDKGSETLHNPETTPPTSESNPPSPTSQLTMTIITKTTNLPATKSGLEELESEDEEDENTEESDEEDSEEDLNETPMSAPTHPPYSLIPPPPVWVQRNQGLMRSWVELIREKAGYVSGMLAPVGIGIAGALVIVGVLYSVRMIHRRRRNSFKHQRRRKLRHTEMKTPETFFHISADEQPRETSSTGQDQAMLLADSSEDEF
ncbi:hypothetical protein UPYG_G00255620 [Umbra pygmaea]|uniref:Armadillo-like helical domain-containing protein 4 n=1 Tax=Umbra pygmaea TaxID=75934 RepID=A0ABD0W985_UMBPY